ncbi:MAG TPA: enoyl-CoA hydratase/isomerase family protein [Mycobacteriales bacterium]|nr:enoyl-CoA hydratase/isomerase family protein [Mycobacteriales bacterium]
MDLDHIAYSKRDGIAILTLQRPEALNVISANPGGTRDQIRWALADASADPEVGCVLLHGAGRAFCAGGDLTGNALRETAQDELDFVKDADEFHHAVRSCRVPVVAAVHGHCLGAGLSLATSCDLLIAADDASFGLPEGRLGLVGAAALVPLIGRQWAKFLIFTGEPVGARRAVDIGLALTVVPAAELLSRCTDLAQRLARMPREALALNKMTVDAVADAGGDEAGRRAGLGHDAVTLAMADHACAPDGRAFRTIIRTEGMAALKQARAAQYETPWLPGRDAAP